MCTVACLHLLPQLLCTNTACAWLQNHSRVIGSGLVSPTGSRLVVLGTICNKNLSAEGLRSKPLMWCSPLNTCKCHAAFNLGFFGKSSIALLYSARVNICTGSEARCAVSGVIVHSLETYPFKCHRD